MVVERTEGKDYELFLRRALRRRPETHKLSFTFGDLILRSRWPNHAIGTVWTSVRRFCSGTTLDNSSEGFKELYVFCENGTVQILVCVESTKSSEN